MPEEPKGLCHIRIHQNAHGNGRGPVIYFALDPRHIRFYQVKGSGDRNKLEELYHRH